MASALPEVAQASKNVDYSVKHSLLNTWTLWFDNPGKKTSAQSWADNLKQVISIDTVEDFWRYENIFFFLGKHAAKKIIDIS